MASGFSSAQTTGIEQNLEFLTPSTGEKFVRWYGDADRSYFLEISEPSDPLKAWFWAPLIKAGNSEDISFEVDGTADKGFFRLQYTDQLPGSGQTLETADYDSDGLSNLYEITLRPRPGGTVGFPNLSPNIQTNPLRADTDGDGLGDNWEEENSLDPTDNGTRDPNNGSSGDPDGDGLSNLNESWYGANPHLADTDGDGINDGDEIAYYATSPTSSDSDSDGLGDFDEIFTYSTEPWNWDTDQDTLSDGDEILIYLTNPLESDTDGDWMWDDYELANSLDPTDPADGMADADGDTLANQLEFVFLDQGFDPVAVNNAAVFPWAGDHDLDGLSTQVEFVTYHTHPRQPDTDGDGLDDAWELQFGFNVLVNNLIAGPSNQNPAADPDGDGLSNSQESAIGTNPNEPDTDSDGVNDGVENNQGSNPNDSNDSQPPPNGTVAVNVTFGDPSASHSEKYRLQFTPLEGDLGGPRFRSNRRYGQVQEDTLRFPKGAKYKIELIHIATNPRYRGAPRPDYDYSLEIDDSANGLAIFDPQGIMGNHYESTSLFAAGKDALLHVPLFEWVTPKGSPVSQPDDIGDGKNEFIYSDATPGVLSMSLRMQVKPTGTAQVVNPDGVKFSDRCFFKLPAIAGSSFVWDALNVGGKATSDGEFITASATYTTLPNVNSEFGLKSASIKCDNEDDVIAPADFEVFYGKDDQNHPGGQAGSPNWFHYWKQFVPLRRIAVLTYNNGISGYGSSDSTTRSTAVSQLASETNDQTGHKGLHSFNETLAHESHHIDLWEGWWGVGGSPNSTDDTDGDQYPNIFELSDIGVIYGFDEADINDLFNQATNSSGYQYEEDECRDAEDSIDEAAFDSQDWSYGLTIKGKNQ